MMSATVATRVREVRDRIDAARQRGGHGQDVVLVAVTKTHGVDAVRAAFDAGVHDVGENRVQEAEPKMAECDVPVRWHLIGHLQRNKARSAAKFDLVHSLDSERLALALDRAAAEAERVVDVLVQVNVSGESSKSGVDRDALRALADRLHTFKALRVRGAMTMAPFDAGDDTLRTVFRGARDARDVLSAAGHPATILSMGMSGDFEVAVEEGATHVRLGTILFGNRS
jgi:pyridoxal phosphate enzyme (YggS family)